MVSTMAISNQNEIIKWKENEQYNTSMHPHSVKIPMLEIRFINFYNHS